MGIETLSRLTSQLLLCERHLLRFCQQTETCYFRHARDLRIICQKCTSIYKLDKRYYAKHFNNFTRTIWMSSSRKRSTINYVTMKSAVSLFINKLSQSLYGQNIFREYKKLAKFMIWTGSLIVPMQIVLWYNFSYNIKDFFCNTFSKYGQCKASQLSPLNSFMPFVPAKNASSNSKYLSLWSSLQECFLINLRAIYLICVFSPLFLVYPLANVSTRCFSLWLRLLYVVVEYSGATFVKLGQWASTRRDLFSQEFCDLFSGLHHRVRPHGWMHTVKTLKQAYGKNWQEILHLSHHQEPIGSGCIAQVYKGYVSASLVPMEILQAMERQTCTLSSETDIGIITDTGSSESMTDTLICDKNVIPVAIKVLHPKITEAFHRDLKLMKAASKFLTILFPRLHWINLNQCVEEFAVTMNKQLDMRYEFQCLQKFTQNFQSFPSIKVPQPIPVFLRQNVLVETFEEGISVSHILRSTEYSSEFKKELAGLGLDVLLQMIFVNNFVHADLHPGNLLVQNIEHFKPKKSVIMHVDVLDTMMVDIYPTEEPSLQLVLLDCGITASLSPDDRLKFREVFTAVVKGESETVAELFLTKSPINFCTNPELFKREMAELVNRGCQNLMKVSNIKVAELMNDLFAVLSRHKIQLEASFATIVLAIAMLEGLGRTLDPDLNLLSRARPVLLEGYLRKKY